LNSANLPPFFLLAPSIGQFLPAGKRKDDGLHKSKNVSIFQIASKFHIASIIYLMHNSAMRTTITLDDGLHEYVALYAAARGLTFSKAVGELIGKARMAPKASVSGICSSPSGLPVFPPTGARLTAKRVKKLEEDDCDSKQLA
jgi:hypothetical protein